MKRLPGDGSLSIDMSSRITFLAKFPEIKVKATLHDEWPPKVAKEWSNTWQLQKSHHSYGGTMPQEKGCLCICGMHNWDPTHQ